MRDHYTRDASPMPPKIVITNRVHPDVIELLQARCRIEVNLEREPWSCGEIIERARDAIGMMVFMTDCIDGDFLTRCPNLRIIASVLKGYDNFDVDACSQNGVWFTVVPNSLTAATAELTVGLMIGISRHLVEADAYVRRSYEGWRPIFYGHGLEHSTVGILGMGAIGQAVAKRLRGFDCRTLYFDERQITANEAISLGVRFAPFEELLKTADFLVIALPLTGRTQHIINADAISNMKENCYIINSARGSIVSEEAVADGLASGKLAGYAADVFEMEDWARKDRPKAICPRLIEDARRTLLTPHVGSAESRARYVAEMEMARSVLDYLDGRAPRGAINNPSISRLPARC
jgi:phosphonate dehydrogenase